MPVTGTLGALTYNKVSLGVNYQYFFIQCLDAQTFGAMTFDNDGAFYVQAQSVTALPAQYQVHKFREYNNYPYKLISGRFTTGSASGGPVTNTTGNFIVYNSTDNRLGLGGVTRIPYQFAFPNPYQNAGAAFSIPKEVVFPSVPTNQGFIDYSVAYLGAGGSWTRIYEDAVVDNSGNYYFVGYSEGSTSPGNPGSQTFFIRRAVNIDSLPGVNNAQTVYYYNAVNTGTTGITNAIALDSSQLPIVCGTATNPGPVRKVVVRKYSNVPTLTAFNYYLPTIWTINLTSTTTFESRAIGIDSSNNIYVVCNDVSALRGYLIKLDSSGNLLWQRRLTNVLLQDLTIDSSGNIYIVGRNSTNNLFVAEYNSSGTIQWQNRMSGATLAGVKIIHQNSSLYVMGNITLGGTARGYVTKLPDDGSIPGDGTYPINGATLTYSTATQTEAAGTVVWATEINRNDELASNVYTPAMSSASTTMNTNTFGLE